MTHYLSSGTHQNYEEIVKTVLFHDVTYQCLPFSKISYNLEMRPFFAYTVPSSLQRQDRLSCDPDFLLFSYYLWHAIQHHRFWNYPVNVKSCVKNSLRLHLLMPIAFDWLPSASEIMERHCEYFPYSVVGVFKLCPLTNDHLFSVLLGQQTFIQLCRSEYVS